MAHRTRKEANGAGTSRPSAVQQALPAAPVTQPMAGPALTGPAAPRQHRDPERFQLLEDMLENLTMLFGKTEAGRAAAALPEYVVTGESGNRFVDVAKLREENPELYKEIFRPVVRPQIKQRKGGRIKSTVRKPRELHKGGALLFGMKK